MNQYPWYEQLLWAVSIAEIVMLPGLTDDGLIISSFALRCVALLKSIVVVPFLKKTSKEKTGQLLDKQKL